MRLYDENLIAVICGKSGISLKWKAKIVQDNLKLKFKEEIYGQRAGIYHETQGRLLF